MERLLKNKKALIIAIIAIIAVVGVVIGVSSMSGGDGDSNSPVVDSVGKTEKEQSIEEKEPTKASAPTLRIRLVSYNEAACHEVLWLPPLYPFRPRNTIQFSHLSWNIHRHRS